MTSGDWLPAQAPFDLVRRGYSPEQVTAHLERLEYDLRITTANRDATNQRLTEFGAQLAAAQAEADMLRSQLDRTALEPVSMAHLSDRMQRMIRLAEEESGEIRARAESDADRLRGQLETAVAEAAETRAGFDAERERTRKQLAEQVNGLIAEATSEAEDTRNLAQEEAGRLLQEANTEAERTVAQANASASQELAEAKAAAATLVRDTAAERERLDAESLSRRSQTEEDFEISMTARRLDATRSISEREKTSAALAENLIGQAKARAEQLVAVATAESDRLMQQATTYSNALVNRASAESHQRVTEAEQAVLALQGLRARVLDQLASLGGHLDHIRELAGSAPALLDPPEAELDLPRAADFPADPAGRPTDVGIPEPVYDPDGTGPAPSRPDGPENGDQSDRQPRRTDPSGQGTSSNSHLADAGLDRRGPVGVRDADGETRRLSIAAANTVTVNAQRSSPDPQPSDNGRLRIRGRKR